MSDIPDSATVRDLESSLARLRGVRGARVVVDDRGSLSITLLVVPERSDDEIVNEVRTAAMAVSGLLVPESQIQILKAGRPGAPIRPERRRRMSSLETTRSGRHFRARVTLELEGDVLVGEDQVLAGHNLEYQAVVGAVLDSVSELSQWPLQLDAIDMLQLGDARLAIVALIRRGSPLVGTALARADDLDAVARATLNALNRILYDEGTRPHAFV